MENICVFASSSNDLARVYNETAYELGERLATEGFGIVFGAGADGLMGQLACGAAEKGGRIVGIIPDVLNLPGIISQHCSDVVAVRTMHERKAAMAEKSDAFIALPGGFGTLEEVLEIITFKQLGIHNKPIVILNAGEFYSHLAAQFDDLVKQGFASEGVRTLFGVKDSVQGAIDYIKHYDPARTYQKHVFLKRDE